MSEVTHTGHEPCPECHSRDNLGRYSDGHAHCFGCGYYEHGDGTEREAGRVQSAGLGLLEGEFRFLKKRKIELETTTKFDYRSADRQQIATYYDVKGRPCAQKIRKAGKKFHWVGDKKRATLFGQQLWAAGGKRIVVTEGEIDAMSMSQVQGNKWPVVSVSDGAGSAARCVAENIEYLSSFEVVVLMFDNDEPGRAAAFECAEILPLGRAAIATLPLKDANEMLVAGRVKELVDAHWRAKPYRPDGIVSGSDLWDLLQEPDPVRQADYPYVGLDTRLHGLRRGEVVTFCAGTGVGKSTVCREIAYALIGQGETVGYVALEESVKESARGLMSIYLNRPLHLRPMDPTDPAFEEAYDATVGNDQCHFYDHWGSTDSDNLLAKLRFLVVALGCRWVVLDHISILVSGLDSGGDNERVVLDRTMTKLGSLARELDFGLMVVCHLKKADGTPFEEGRKVTLGDLRGSAGVAQISNAVVALERNLQAEGNETRMRILKNRFSGWAGVCGVANYDEETGRLNDGGTRRQIPETAQSGQTGGEDESEF